MQTDHVQNAHIDFIRTITQSYVHKLAAFVPHGVIQMALVLPVIQAMGLQ
jgi:hypothetical protein